MLKEGIVEESIVTPDLIEETIDNMWKGRSSTAYSYGKRFNNLVPTDSVVDEIEEDYPRV